MGVASAETPKYNLPPREKRGKNKLEATTEDCGDINSSDPKTQDVRGRRVRKRPRPLMLTSPEEDGKRRKKGRIGNVEDDEVPIVNNWLSPTKLRTQSQETPDRSVPDTEPPSETLPGVAEERSPEKRELRPSIPSTSVILGHEHNETQPLSTWTSPGFHGFPNEAHRAPLPTPYSPYTRDQDLAHPSRTEISHNIFFRHVQSAPASTTSFETSDLRDYRGGPQTGAYRLESPFQYSPREAGFTPAHFSSAGACIPNQSMNISSSNTVLGNSNRNLDMLATTAVSSPDNRSQYRFDIVEIVHNMYLGSCFVLHPNNFERFRNLRIKRIFSIRTREELQAWETETDQLIYDGLFERTWLHIHDDLFTDILQHLPGITEEIHEALNSGRKVYVHCQMGHSRSVSIVLAYLIRYHDLSLTAALNLVREKRPFVRPNRSFYAQLQFWEAAKSALTFNASPEYRHMRMAKDAKAFSQSQNGYGGRSLFMGEGPLRRTMKEFMEIFPIFRDPSHPKYAESPFQKPKDNYYCCSQCRSPLAPAASTFGLTLEHDISKQCTHIFLCAPMSWMDSQIDPSGPPGGTLYCPFCPDDCTAVGEYCWFGVQCQTCGEFVSPGVALRTNSPRIPGVEFQSVSYDQDEDEIEPSYETEEEMDALDEFHLVDYLSEDQQSELDAGAILREERAALETLLGRRVDERSVANRNGSPVPRSLPTPENLTTNPRHLPPIPSPLRNRWTLSQISNDDSHEFPESNEEVLSDDNPHPEVLSPVSWMAENTDRHEDEHQEYMQWIEEVR